MKIYNDKNSLKKVLEKQISSLYLHSVSEQGNTVRKHSSAGSEHLPYKQGVRGSIPCASTLQNLSNLGRLLF